MIFRRVVAAFLVLALIVVPVRSSYATVATGAVTGRNVFSLTATGAAKVAAAELSIANAVRILGMFGRFAGWVGVGLVVVDIARSTWDWWNQEYDAGVASTATTGQGSVGVTSSYYVSGAMTCADGFSAPADAIPTTWTVVGRQAYTSTTSFGGAHGECSWTYVYGVETSSLPTASVGAMPPGEDGRQVFVDQINGAISDLENAALNTVGVISLPVGTTFDELKAALLEARGYVSNGVTLAGSDYIQGTSYASGSTSLAGNAVPTVTGGVTPSPVASTVDLSGVISAVSVGSAAVSSAIAASQAAVVSAVQAVAAPIVAAIAASQAAVVSAVQAVAAPIVAAIAASQAAVVSAVGSIVAPIVASITGVQTAVESVGAKVDSLAAQQAAQDAVVPSVPVAVQCVGCARFGADEWALLWGMIRTDGMAAPIFGLIARLVWPGGGSIDRTWSVGTWQGHAMTVDLEASGLATAITVVRFVVVGGAVIVAYMIIFG